VIILDTDVLSALMRTKPDTAVVAWLDQQPVQSIWITSITLFEARFGIALLAQGRRRREIEKAFVQVLLEDLEGRVLEVDQPAAERAAALAAERQRVGRTIDFRDTLIAGIVLARRATLATHHRKDFEDLSVPVINPWEGE
jgi:predicted nucleic acid-binding protein